MTELLKAAFRAAERLPPYDQSELAERILYEVRSVGTDRTPDRREPPTTEQAPRFV